MSTQKKSVIYLAFLLVFCTILAGCAVYAETAIYEPYLQISSFLSSSNNSSEPDSSSTSDITSNDSESNQASGNSSQNNSSIENNKETNAIVQYNNKNNPDKEKSANEKLEKAKTNSENQKTPADISYLSPTVIPTLPIVPAEEEPALEPTKEPVVTLEPTKAPVPTKAPTPTIAPTKAPSPTNAPVNTSIVMDNLLGKSKSYIIEQFGNPVSTEKSEYGFYWYVYHKNFTGFIMIGIQNDKVVGLYSNSAALSFKNLKVGTSRSTVRSVLSDSCEGPVTSILKGNIRYNLTNTDQKDVFYDSSKYVTIFYDNIENGTLTSVQIIDYSTEQSFGYFPAPDSEFAASYERISFYLINSIRVRFKMPVLIYDNNMAKIAAAHSQDMIDRNFFAHENPDGLKNADRIKAAGFSYYRCAENIAKNHPNAINAHEAYMNSSGHRANILRDVKYVGIGVRMVKGAILQTEVFITYPN